MGENNGQVSPAASADQSKKPTGKNSFLKPAVEVLRGLADFKENQDGGLASELTPPAGEGSSIIDVAANNKYRWTLSNIDTTEIPYIMLREYMYDDVQMKLHWNNFVGGAVDKFKSSVRGATSAATGGLVNPKSSKTNSMDMYNRLYPKDKPTGFNYKFPYFNKIGFELSSPDWSPINQIGASDVLGKVGEMASTATKIAGSFSEQAVGAVDIPKIFKGHQDRSIVISFTLFNTLNPNDWKANKSIGYQLMSQNLFNKRDYVTGKPPVIYDVYIPGQYYCYAAAMTNIKVEHAGNQRLIDENVVPDAYSFELTLTELVKPSKNQFESISSGYHGGRITVRTQKNLT